MESLFRAKYLLSYVIQLLGDRKRFLFKIQGLGHHAVSEDVFVEAVRLEGIPGSGIEEHAHHIEGLPGLGKLVLLVLNVGQYLVQIPEISVVRPRLFWTFLL